MTTDANHNREISVINSTALNSLSYNSIFSQFATMDLSRVNVEGGLTQEVTAFTPDLDFKDLQPLAVASTTTEQRFFKYTESKDTFLLCHEEIMHRYHIKESSLHPTESLVSSAISGLNLRFDNIAMNGSVNGYGMVNNPNTITNVAIDGTNTSDFITAIANLQRQLNDTVVNDGDVFYWACGQVRNKLDTAQGDNISLLKYFEANIRPIIAEVLPEVLNADVMIAFKPALIQGVWRKMPRLDPANGRGTNVEGNYNWLRFETDAPSLKLGKYGAVIVQPFSAL